MKRPLRNIERDVALLVGDATKARDKLGWKNQITFESLIREMVESDVKLFTHTPNA